MRGRMFGFGVGMSCPMWGGGFHFHPPRRFPSEKEYLEMLELYKKELEEELEGVKQEIEELQKQGK